MRCNNADSRGLSMDFSSQDIPRLVFRASIQRDMGQVSLSASMLDVLRELDGKKPVLAVSRSLQIPMNALREILSHLHRLNLIETVQRSREAVDPPFFQYLESRLADVMGPMAVILIREEIDHMGEEAAQFPKERTAELIDRLADKIFVESKRQAFLASMRSA